MRISDWSSDVCSSDLTKDTRRKFELWVFRDITDESRLSLLKLVGLPVNEIGKVHSHQRIGLKLVLRQLASTYHQADDATVERVARAIAKYERGDWCRRLEWQNWIGHAKAAIAAMRSEEHTSELQSLMRISYAVFCLKKKNNKTIN